MALLRALHMSTVPSFIVRNNPSGRYLQCIPTNRCSRLVERLGVWALQFVNGDGPLRCCGWWTFPQTGTRSNEPGIDMNCTACPESIPNESNQNKKPSKVRSVTHEHSYRSMANRAGLIATGGASNVFSWSVPKNFDHQWVGTYKIKPLNKIARSDAAE